MTVHKNPRACVSDYFENRFFPLFSVRTAWIFMCEFMVKKSILDYNCICYNHPWNNYGYFCHFLEKTIGFLQGVRIRKPAKENGLGYTLWPEILPKLLRNIFLGKILPNIVDYCLMSTIANFKFGTDWKPARFIVNLFI